MQESDRLVLEHLSQFASEHKKLFIERVLAARTRYVTVVLEDIFQSQNASAVVRTCECMGIQDVHIVENTTKYHTNVRVLKGSDKWINLNQYRDKGDNNSEKCFAQLRADGYRILVADPGEEGVSIHDVDVAAGRVALVFGNELRGISDYAIQHSDGRVRIPMYGFTESLNISVSVGISLNTLVTKLYAQDIDFRLTPGEREALRLSWYRKIVRGSDLIEREFLRSIQ